MPNRISDVLLVTAAMKSLGVGNGQPAIIVSCLFSILSLVLLAWIGLRFFNPAVALGAVTFLAFSVGELGIAVRAWPDATLAFFGLLMVYFTCELTRDPRRIVWYPAFLGAGALLLLTKQTGILGYGACALWAMWVAAREERYWKGVGMIAAGVLASIALTLWIWGALAGGVGVALSAFGHSLHLSAMGRAYVETVCTGPWTRFFRRSDACPRRDREPSSSWRPLSSYWTWRVTSTPSHR